LVTPYGECGRGSTSWEVGGRSAWPYTDEDEANTSRRPGRPVIASCTCWDRDELEAVPLTGTMLVGQLSAAGVVVVEAVDADHVDPVFEQ
jgi:hypothetical protein